VGLVAKVIEQERHEQYTGYVHNNIKLIVLLAVAANGVNIVQSKYTYGYPKKVIDSTATNKHLYKNSQYNAIGKYQKQ